MTNRLARDLQWCLQSPPIMRADEHYVNDEFLDGLEVPLTAETDLPVPRHPHHFRLGLLFEQFWQRYLQASSQFEVIANALQVQDGKRTVGEFDLLVSHSNEVEHWEIAIKFYLGVGNTRQIGHWFGPNTSDRLDIKIDRLDSHQLRLGEHPSALALLAERGLNISRVRSVVKGRLFYPATQFTRGQFEHPDRFHPNHLKGWWCTLEEFQHAPSANRYILLNKVDWLSPIHHDDSFTSWDHDQLVDYLRFGDAEQVTHVALLNDRNDEMSRGFVVQQQWIDHVESNR